MYYVYVLKSKSDKHLYTGCTNDLKKRMSLHNFGKIESTQKRIPLSMIFYEAFIDKSDAFRREQWLKTGWGRNHLNTMLRNSLKI
jgi:putative endonuclease